MDQMVVAYYFLFCAQVLFLMDIVKNSLTQRQMD